MPTRPPSRSFEDLIVWQRAHQFVLSIYSASGDFPRAELFGLTSQLRRAAVSIPANIAEGYKRRGRLEKVRFFNVAQGSAEECRYYLILAQDLGYIDSTNLHSELSEVIRLLEGYVSGILSHEA